ncbi:H-NS family nucleoid-associated regulatory protein [Paraburkholderia sp. MM5482-R1]|uniref:H-NS family nucleoid-associated regulatory protein n=1 Tax=unclassified Paraburkholderia TaxID=2615204 RepID=UPI003D215A1D
MATLEQIEEKMKKLQSQAEALFAKQSSAVLANIKALMEKHGLTTADIDAHVGGAQKRGRKPGASAANGKAKAAAETKGGLPPKYRDPKTGATWSGHARPPSWIKDVKDRTRFLTADGDAAVAATSGAAGKAKAAVENASAVGSAGAHTGQRKGPQPAKYRDPKSGATWSGRGPAPAWLAAVKDRTKFLIEGASAGTTETRAVNRASKPNAAVKRGAVAKKAAVKKVATTKVAPAKQTVVAKKVAAKKAPAKKTVAPAATKVAVKKAPAKKAVAKTVVAKPDVSAAPASVTVQATA